MKFIKSKHFKQLILLVVGLTFTACSKNDDSGSGGSSFEIPSMTAPVTSSSGASFTGVESSMEQPINNDLTSSAIIQSSNTTQYSSGSTISGSTTPTNTQAASFKNLVKSFLDFGKVTDQFSCFAKVLVNNGVVSANGSSVVFYDDQDSSASKAKFSVVANGSELSNYKMYICNSGSTTNNFYVAASKSGNNITFNMKYNYSSILKGIMSVSGQVSGANWLSKTVEMQNVVGTSTNKFLITQNSSSMILKVASDAASGTDYLMYGKFGLSGSGPSTYVMSDGTAKYLVNGTGSELTTHWDSNGANASTSSFAADVASASYYSLPLTFSGDITADETWDCSNGSNTTVPSSTLSSTVLTQLNACSNN